MYTGTVKFYNELKGYGFIIDPQGKEVFFHATKIKDKVCKENIVTFDLEETKRGMNAINVTRVV